mgnify:CR=1 FL=1
MDQYHRSVLLREAVDALNIRDAWYLDCTLGDGGHSIEIIKRGGKVVGIDVDPQALERVQRRFRNEENDENKLRLVKGNFRDIKNLIRTCFARSPVSPDFTARSQNLAFLADAKNVKQTDTASQKFAGAIFDLGVSSLQLESPERGFSFAKLGPLDMRMDPSLAVAALDLLNALSRKELYGLFKNLGEEKYSKRLADTLVSAREVRPIKNTLELAEIVEKVVGRREKIHPATRVFQALRIAVNDELGALQEGLDQVKDLIEKNGHIVVISFQSLEDRIVKNTFKQWEIMGLGKVLTKKPVVPDDLEIADNPRSRSAKMRVFEKL